MACDIFFVIVSACARLFKPAAADPSRAVLPFRPAMDPARLRDLLEQLRKGDATVDEAMARLRDLPFSELGYATVDHHRALRQGVPEVIFGESKTAEQITGIAVEMVRAGQNVLVSRVDQGKAEAVARSLPALVYNPLGRTATLVQSPIVPLGGGKVALVTAGTSDLPVAEECAETLRMLGAELVKVNDVGVAGIHRLLSKRDVLTGAAVVIVFAGMEGALASVVGGLVQAPVVAVPTSVGYGAAFHGVAALLGMLTSCASGITVVNIDNGFGAAFAAARILRAARASGTTPAT
jgi:hypothetical protein